MKGIIKIFSGARRWKGRLTAIGVIIISILIISSLIFPIGCAKKGKEIKIGAIFALTGDYAPWGERARKGAELAVEEINEEGKLKVKIIYEDSSGDPAKAVSAFRKLTEADKVKFILGPLSSVEALAVAPIAEKKKVIVLTPVSSAPKLTYAGDYIFRNCASDIFEGSIAAEYTRKALNKKTAAILYVNNDYGLGIREAFKKRFTELKGKIVAEETFNVGDKDFRTQLIKIKTKKPHVIILAGYAKEMAQILRQAHEIGLKVQFMSFSPFEAPEVLEIAGKTAEGAYYVYQGFNPESGEEIVKKFVAKYKERYNETPDIFAALTYDAVRIYAEAFKKGDNDVEKVKKALYEIKDFQGVTGKTSIDENGDAIKPIGIKKVKNGKFVWVNEKFKF